MSATFELFGLKRHRHVELNSKLFFTDKYTFSRIKFGAPICIVIEWLRKRTEHLNIYFFPPITQWCSISDVLFTGGRECQILMF